jgi:hypothetical protein
MHSVFTVIGDVDFDVGNIDIPGDVEIRGLVGSGSSVTVGGTISVAGTTEPGATLQVGGDVLVGQGILGEKTCVIADGSVTTKFIQNSVVTVGGDITVSSYIFNGRVSADEIAAKTEQQLSCGRIRARQDLFSDLQVQIGPWIRHVTKWITGGCEFHRSDGRVQWRVMDD